MVIPAGGYAIIADNATEFLNEHSSCTCNCTAVIDSAFSLHNTEEHIALKNGTLDIIDNVTYNASWGANGTDRTLELNDATDEWEESRAEGGTPCEPNSVSRPSVLTRINVTPETATLRVSETQQITATAYDQYNGEMTGVDFTWSSSNETVGTVNDTGFFTADVPGTTTVKAANGTVNGTAVVTVIVYGVDLSVSPAVNTTTPGKNATYTLMVKNTGTVLGNYTLEITTYNETNASLNRTEIANLPNGSSAVVLLNVTNTSSGSYIVDVAVTSREDSSKSDTVKTTTTVDPGPTDSVEITATPVTILADGKDVSTITAILTDEFGNKVTDGTVVAFSSNRSSDAFSDSGINTTSETTINGNATVYLTGSAAGTSNISAENNDISDHVYVNMSSVITESNTTAVKGNESVEIVRVEDDAAIEVNTTADLTANITATITTNASLINVSDATAQYGIATDERSIGRYLNVTTDIDLEKLSSVDITLLYNDADLDLNENGIIGDVGDIDEHKLKIYWWSNASKVWKPLDPVGTNYSSEDDGPTVLNISRNVTANELTVTLNHFSTFCSAGATVITSSATPGGDGSSGGGGGGGVSSNEPFANIEKYETREQYLYADREATYSFTTPDLGVYMISVTPAENAGSVSARVDLLKDTSTIVDLAPDGVVYKNVNIWLGTSGFATSENIRDAVIRFKVSRDWPSAHSVDSIVLMQYTGGNWVELKTVKIGESDGDILYESSTDHFSCFAIVGKAKEMPVVPDKPTDEVPSEVVQPTPEPTEEEGKSPGFGALYTLIGILATVFLFRRRL